MDPILEEMSIRDNIRLYNDLADRCFGACVSTFHADAVSAKERGCLTRCVTKFLKGSTRVNESFQQAMAKAQAGQQQ
jgi:import inner membrane translocase subunit TIM9